MAEAGVMGQKQPGNAGPIAVLVLVFVVPVVILGIILFMVAGGHNPNSGSSLPQPISVAKPSSEVAKLLNTFSIASNPQDFLKKNSQVLATYKANLENLNSKLDTYAAITDKAAAQALITKMLAEINTIEQQVGTGANAQTAKVAQQLINDGRALDKLSGNSIATIALQYASDNAASGYTKYPYEPKDHKPNRREQIMKGGTGYSDCSSFASEVLFLSGVSKTPIAYDTSWLYTAAKAGKSGFHIVLASTSDTGLTTDQVRNTVQPGDIILSGNNYTNDNNGGSEAHTVIFVGNDQVVESSSVLHNGIYTDSLTNRLKRHTQVIIRADGV